MHVCADQRLHGVCASVLHDQLVFLDVHCMECVTTADTFPAEPIPAYKTL